MSGDGKDYRLISQGDRIRLVNEALAREAPDSNRWARGNSPATSDFRGQSLYWIEVRSPLRPAVQRLNILLRHDGDIQVEYHIGGKRGSPFEMLFVLEEGQESAGIEGVARFVADVLAERLALAYSQSLFKGGRRFFKPGSLTESHRHSLSWITSWLGTFDWPAPPIGRMIGK